MGQAWLLGFLFGFCSNFCFSSAWIKGIAYTVGEIGAVFFFCIGGWCWWKKYPILAAMHPVWLRYGCWVGGVIWGIGHTALPPSAMSKGHPIDGVRISWLYPVALVQQGDSLYMGRAIAASPTREVSYWGRTPSFSGWWPVHLNAMVYTRMRGWSAWGDEIRASFGCWIARRLEPLPLSEQAWLRGIFLGEMEFLSIKLKNWFKQLGIFHIIVISGFHIGFLGNTLQQIAAGILRLAYGLLWISSPWYQRGMRWVKWSVLGLVFAFSFCIGFTPPVQRAFLSYGYREWFWSSSKQVPLGRFLLHVVGLQIFFFPTTFLTVSTLMSWLSYTTVLAASREASLGKVFKSYLFLQTGPFLFAGVFFQSLCFLSFFANLIFVPMFSAVFLAGFVLLSLPPDGLGYHLARTVQQVYLEGIEKFANLLQVYPLLYVDISHKSAGYKRCLFIISLCFLFVLTRRVQYASLRRSCKSK